MEISASFKPNVIHNINALKIDQNLMFLFRFGDKIVVGNAFHIPHITNLKHSSVKQIKPSLADKSVSSRQGLKAVVARTLSKLSQKSRRKPGIQMRQFIF